MVHNDLWLICGYKVVFTVPIEEYFEFGRVTQRVRWPVYRYIVVMKKDHKGKTLAFYRFCMKVLLTGNPAVDDIFYSCSSCSLFSVLFIPVKLKVFSILSKWIPGKVFCFPLLVPARFLLPFPLFSSSPPHKIHFFVGAPSIHHRSVDEGKQWQRDGNETNQGKRRRRLLHVGRRNGKN